MVRITHLSASGLLSFQDFRLDFPKRRTVIVGPNGSGKSNVGRLVELVTMVMQAADRDSPDLRAMLTTYFAARRLPVPAGGIEIRMGYELDSDREKELVVAYLRAAIVSDLTGNTQGMDLTALDSWAAEKITAPSLEPLYCAEVVVSHTGAEDGRWHIGVDFSAENDAGRIESYRWVLIGNQSDSIVGVNDLASFAVQSKQLAYIFGGSASTQPTAPSGDFTLSRVLPGPKGAVQIRMQFSGGPPLPVIRRFATLIEVSPLGQETNRYVSLARVFTTIFGLTLIQTSDRRLLPLPGHSWSTPDAELRAGGEANFPELLLRLKNGPSANTLRYSAVQRLFKEFTHGRELDVAMQFRPLTDEESEPGIAVQPRPLVSIGSVAEDNTGAVEQVPIEFAGAGAWEAMTLALILGSQAYAVAILDEPAVALHPSLQRLLQRHLDGSTAQFILITHSPYLLPLSDHVDDVQVVRLDRDDGLATRKWTVQPEMWKFMTAKLRAKGNERLPFSWRAVLCEGQLDVLALRILARRASIDLDWWNVAVLDCGGRDNHPDYIRLSGALGIRHLVVADADSRTPDAAANAQRVRQAVAAEPLAQLVEFPVDLETTLGCPPKDARCIEAKCEAMTLDETAPQEVLELLKGLRSLMVTTTRSGDGGADTDKAEDED